MVESAKIARPKIGLEVHIQVNSQSKAFSGEPNSINKEANTSVNEITLAHPGTLPYVNHQLIDSAIRLAMACQCKISRKITFSRKNYFYPDLPKGFQITQENAIAKNGRIPVILDNGKVKHVKIRSIHVEEDSGQRKPDKKSNSILVDLNRAGKSLIELVTQPILHSVEEVRLFLMELRKIVQYLEISSGNMEEGNLRCDVNVSVSGSKNYCELKNINSFSIISKAIDYEIKRQTALLHRKKKIKKETRFYALHLKKTIPVREKEETGEYRYIPEPDLPAISIHKERLKILQKSLPVLPFENYTTFKKTFHLDTDTALFLSDEIHKASFALELFKFAKKTNFAANQLKNNIQELLNQHQITYQETGIEAKKLAEVINHAAAVKTDQQKTRAVYSKLFKNPNLSVNALFADVKAEVTKDDLSAEIKKILKQYPDELLRYRSGEKALYHFFVGQIMRKLSRSVNYHEIKNILKSIIANYKS